MKNNANIGIADAFQVNSNWYFTATIGPFSSREDADEFARRLGSLEPKDEAPRPALGVFISDTINTKDKFG